MQLNKARYVALQRVIKKIHNKFTTLKSFVIQNNELRANVA